jgi:hypothetical protein
MGMTAQRHERSLEQIPVLLVMTTFAWSVGTTRAVRTLRVAAGAGQPAVTRDAEVSVVCVAVQQLAAATHLAHTVHAQNLEEGEQWRFA